jgi:hypothetical protein
MIDQTPLLTESFNGATYLSDFMVAETGWPLGVARKEVAVPGAIRWVERNVTACF